MSKQDQAPNVRDRSSITRLHVTYTSEVKHGSLKQTMSRSMAVLGRAPAVRHRPISPARPTHLSNAKVTRAKERAHLRKRSAETKVARAHALVND